jgi:hypothetical protein
MGASASSGVKICATKPGVTGTAMAATAASKAAPAVITVADTTGMYDGQLIKLAADSTGLSTLDGKTFVVEFAAGDVPGTATTFKLLGSDSTADTGVFAAGADMTAWGKADMQCLCFSEFSFNPETPNQISTATYCNPQDAIASWGLQNVPVLIWFGVSGANENSLKHRHCMSAFPHVVMAASAENVPVSAVLSEPSSLNVVAVPGTSPAANSTTNVLPSSVERPVESAASLIN